MKKKILYTLEAYLLTNRDVLTPEEIKGLEKQIKVMKRKIVILF
jgi:hypothetical protein